MGADGSGGIRRPDPGYRPLGFEHASWARALRTDKRLRSFKPPLGQTPCRGCTRCCQNDTIILHPEFGDDASQYQTRRLEGPNGEPGPLALAQQANRDCVYLDRATGCTIHGQAPFTCREFDCRMLYLNRHDPRIKAHLDIAAGLGVAKKDVLARGRQLFQERHGMTKGSK